MGNTHGMVSNDINLPWGVTRMRKLTSFYFFERKPIILENRYEHWRGVADLLRFTSRERLRVEWIAFYYTTGRNFLPVKSVKGKGTRTMSLRLSGVFDLQLDFLSIFHGVNILIGMVQQLVAAILNNAVFGSSPTGPISIAQAKICFANPNATVKQLRDAASAMAAFNESGDSGVFTPGISANGKLAKDTAYPCLAFWDLP
jgi:hypothetical protein